MGQTKGKATYQAGCARRIWTEESRAQGWRLPGGLPRGSLWSIAKRWMWLLAASAHAPTHDMTCTLHHTMLLCMQVCHLRCNVDIPISICRDLLHIDPEQGTKRAKQKKGQNGKEVARKRENMNPRVGAFMQNLATFAWNH